MFQRRAKFFLFGGTTMLATIPRRHNITPFFDDWFQDLWPRRFQDLWSRSSENYNSFDLDVKQEGQTLVVTADVPGVAKEDLSVTVENGILTIAAERKMEKETKESDFHIKERSYGKFCRSIQLPADIDQKSVNAKLENGVLKLVLDKSAESKLCKISIS